jgi:choline dehydrogenase
MCSKTCSKNCSKDCWLDGDTFDFIVVGAGSAGSFIIDGISNRKYTVLAIEAGRDNTLDSAFTEDATPEAFAGFSNGSQGTKFTDKLQGRPDASAGGTNTDAWGGNGWGGSSGHNYLQAFRTSPEFHSRLSALAGADWDYTNAVQIYKEIEDYSDGASADRGVGGPIGIYRPADAAPNSYTVELCNALVAVAPTADAGLSIVTDYNANVDIAVTPTNQIFTRLQPDTSLTRSYAGNEILQKIVYPNGNPKLNRKVKLISNARVNRVLFSKENLIPKAVGVEIEQTDENNRGVHKTYYARLKIILTAGAMRTPEILERSGYGDRDILNNYDIPVIYHNPAVGENLMNHPAFAAIIEVDTADVFNGFTRNSYFAPNALLRLNPGATNRNIQTIGFPGSFGGLLGREVGQNVTIPIPALGAGPTSPLLMAAFYLASDGRGSSHITSKNLHVTPDYTYTAYASPRDDETLVNFYKLVRDWVNQAATDYPTKTYNLLYPPASAFASDADLATLAKAATFYAAHYSGTCKMSEVDGVVDYNLHVRGVSNLMVADNSVWPIMPDGNTCLPAYYLGKRAVQIINAQLPVTAFSPP